MGEEKRRHPRRRVLKSGKIAFNGRHSVFDCTVRNLSDGGALLLFPRPPVLPAAFELRLEDGTIHECRQAWQSMTAMGVAFLDPVAHPTAGIARVEVRIGDRLVMGGTGLEQVRPTSPEDRIACIQALGEAIAALSRS